MSASFHCQANILLAVLASGINETNDALLIPFLQHDPWEPSWTMLLSDPCVHRGTSTARLPPGSPPLTRPPLLLLPSVTLRLTITLLNLRKQRNPGIFFKYHNILLFALMFFFLLNSEKKGNSFSEVFWATSKQLHASSSSSSSTGAMSSPLSHSKDQPRIRKTTADSSPTSLTARSLRVRLTN